MGHLPQLPALAGDAYTIRIDIPDYLLAVWSGLAIKRSIA